MSTDSVACANCGTPNPLSAKYCKGCGQPTASVACTNCGAQNTRWAHFCEQCGAKLAQPAPTESDPAPPFRAIPTPSQSFSQPVDRSAGGWAQPVPRAAIEYATGWRRLGAILLDILILIFPLAAIAVVGYLIGGERSSQFLPSLASSIYFWIMNGNGATLGKKITGIRVVDEAGNAPGLGAGFIRNLLPGWLPLITATLILPSGIEFVIGLVAIIDVIKLIFDSRKQAIHDSLAKTFVVREA